MKKEVVFWLIRNWDDLNKTVLCIAKSAFDEGIYEKKGHEEM